MLLSSPICEDSFSGNILLKKTLKKEHKIPSEGAALHYSAQNSKINISVLLTYTERLRNFGFWHEQLIAESLGKKNTGFTLYVYLYLLFTSLFFYYNLLMLICFNTQTQCKKHKPQTNIRPLHPHWCVPTVTKW